MPRTAMAMGKITLTISHVISPVLTHWRDVQYPVELAPRHLNDRHSEPRRSYHAPTGLHRQPTDLPSIRSTGEPQDRASDVAGGSSVGI